jgi:hypothetical protein
MRTIYLDDEVRIRFPGQGPEFDEGVEVGMIAAMMVAGEPTISRWVSQGAIVQLRELAPKLRYRLTVDPAQTGDLAKAVLVSARVRPQLRLVR